MLWKDVCRYTYVLILCSVVTLGIAYLAGEEPPSAIYAAIFAMGWTIIVAVRENRHD